MGIYGLSGMLTGIAAALLLARLSSGDPTFGTMFELDAIAAAVMGGTSLTGGEGTVAGTIIGALIISLVRNAINIFNIPSYWQQVIIGSVIVLAVMLDQWRKKQSRQQ
jgi:ribose/xylose/arabinose/galactoside ABC-type transport system permease subunit